MTDLREHLIFPSKKQIMKVVEIVKKEPALFEQLVKLSFTDEQPLGRYAAWAMNHYLEKNKDEIRPYLPKLIAYLPHCKHHNQQGSLMKFLSWFPDVEDENMGAIVDLCFDLLTSKQEVSYLKYYSISILVNICQQEPDLASEVLCVFEDVAKLDEKLYMHNELKAGMKKLEKLVG